MRLRRICLVFAVSWPDVALAADGEAVTVCDTLLAARRIDATPDAHRADAPGPDCRRIARDALGTVERRAMIGGAPYECLNVADAGRCLWVVP